MSPLVPRVGDLTECPGCGRVAVHARLLALCNGCGRRVRLVERAAPPVTSRSAFGRRSVPRGA